jgi:hypothetical protein
MKASGFYRAQARETASRSLWHFACVAFAPGKEAHLIEACGDPRRRVAA